VTNREPEEHTVDQDRTDQQPDPDRARTVPSGATREAERDDAGVTAGADRPPTDDEEHAAPTEVTDEQRSHEEEMLERGAHQQGEGRIV